MSSALPVLLSRTGRSRLLARDIIEGILWTLLPDFRLVRQDDSDKKKRVRATRAQRIELLQSILVMSPDAPEVPHMATVNWHADVPEWTTEYLVPEVKGGQYQYDGEGNPKLTVEHRRPYTVRGSTKLPDKEGHTLVDTEVLPLIVCDGNGGLVPYVTARQQGGEVVYIGVDGMLCIFVQDIDPLTWEPKASENGRPYYKAIPVALARQETVRMWNDLVERRAAQNPSYPKDAELVRPFAHNLYGRKVLKFTPQGHPAYRDGLLGILPPKKHREVKDSISPDDARWVVGQLVGKTVKPGKGITLILPDDGRRFQAHKLHIEEQWTGIEVVNVDGLWGAGTRVGSHVVAAEQETINALAALGLTLYSTSPLGVKPWVDELLKAPVGDQNPLVVYLRNRGDIEVDTPEATVRQAMRAMYDILVKRGRDRYRDALKLIVHDLESGSGQHAHGLSLADALGSTQDNPIVPTPELIRQAHDATTEDLLAAAIVGSQTAKDLGLEVWDGNCWVLVESRKALLLALASQAGITMADPPAPPVTQKAEQPAAAEPTEGEQPPVTT